MRAGLIWPLVASTVVVAHAGAPEQKETLRATRPQWIERPWELDYVVQVDSSRSHRVAKKWATDHNAPKNLSDRLGWAGVIDLSHQISINPMFPGNDLVISRIEFDPQGIVTTPHTHGSPLRGRLTDRLDIVLATGDGPRDPVYPLGPWFQGFGGSEHWAPTLCSRSGNDHADPALPSDHKTMYLYGKGYRHDEFVASFGCREWAYQLKDPDRPYIDVTSYRPGAKPANTRVHPFVGWAYAGQARKPVIGLNLGQWYCLLDCPQGEVPGRIDDIRLWAKRNGWQAPRQPKQMPMFPDSTAERGDDHGD